MYNNKNKIYFTNSPGLESAQLWCWRMGAHHVRSILMWGERAINMIFSIVYTLARAHGIVRDGAKSIAPTRAHSLTRITGDEPHVPIYVTTAPDL